VPVLYYMTNARLAQGGPAEPPVVEEVAHA
jgi:hypothetical protein